MSKLLKKELDKNPFVQFAKWFEEAENKSGMQYPNAVTLGTVTPDGSPDSRIVLLKQFDERGFVFFTNSNSMKGQALAKTEKASMTFYWDKLERQVRVRGDVEKTTSIESDEYFSSRPRQSRIGAWASSQSTELASREELEKRFAEFEQKFKDVEVPRPEYWKGYRIVPVEIEFWQARSFRLHDRFLYKRTGTDWSIARLSP